MPARRRGFVLDILINVAGSAEPGRTGGQASQTPPLGRSTAFGPPLIDLSYPAFSTESRKNEIEEILHTQQIASRIQQLHIDWNSSVEPEAVSLEAFDQSIVPSEPGEMRDKLLVGVALLLHTEVRAKLSKSQFRRICQDCWAINAEKLFGAAEQALLRGLINLAMGEFSKSGRANQASLAYFQDALQDLPRGTSWYMSGVRSFARLMARFGDPIRAWSFAEEGGLIDDDLHALQMLFSGKTNALARAESEAAKAYFLMQKACDGDSFLQLVSQAKRPEEKIRAYLLGSALKLRRGMRRLGRPKNVRQHARRTFVLSNDIERLLDVSTKIDELLRERPSDTALSRLIDALKDLTTLERLVDELLCLAFVAVRLNEVGETIGAQVFFGHYERLCLVASDGRNEDIFGIYRSSPETAARPVSRIEGLTAIGKAVGSSYVRSWAQGLRRQRAQKRSSRAETLEAITGAMVDIAEKQPGALAKALVLGEGIPGLLPVVVRDRVKAFHNDCTPILPKEVEEQVRLSLGRSPREIFDSWDDKPLGVGTESQVHRAVRSGVALAVKVKRPKIRELISRQYDTFSKFSPLVQSFFSHINLKDFLQYYKGICLKHSDLFKEGNDMVRAATILSKSEGIHVPRVVKDLSNLDVLSMDFLEGLTFAEVQELCSQDERSFFGRKIFEAEIAIIGHKLFRLDIHPGNYLLMENGIAYIDVQLVETGGQFPNWLSRFVLASQGNWGAVEDTFRKDGLFFDTPTELVKDFMRVSREITYRPFTEEEFEFTPEYARSVFDAQIDLVRRGMPIKPEVFARSRFFWSLFGILAQLRAKGAFAEIVKSVEKSLGD